MNQDRRCQVFISNKFAQFVLIKRKHYIILYYSSHIMADVLWRKQFL